MAIASIPVDLLNPGQVFACLGFTEAADKLCGNARGGFDWSSRGNTRFHLEADGEENPIAVVLDFLTGATVHSNAPHGADLTTQGWKVPTVELPADAPFPFALPDSPATLPTVLSNGAHSIVLEHWGDSTRRDSVKFWAGAGGYPGAALTRDALGLAERFEKPLDAPFDASAVQSSSFRFDWRRDYVPLDTGFSLNEHPHITSRGFPIVELLAAVGLTHARPERPDRRSKLAYRYAVVGKASDSDPNELTELDPTFLRAALGCAPLPFPTRTFRMTLDWPGKENQARCITGVTEENTQ